MPSLRSCSDCLLLAAIVPLFDSGPSVKRGASARRRRVSFAAPLPPSLVTARSRSHRALRGHQPGSPAGVTPRREGPNSADRVTSGPSRLIRFGHRVVESLNGPKKTALTLIDSESLHYEDGITTFIVYVFRSTFKSNGLS